MNIKIENEKKAYVAPSMDIVNMDRELILCCSGGNCIHCEIEGTNEEFN